MKCKKGNFAKLAELEKEGKYQLLPDFA